METYEKLLEDAYKKVKPIKAGSDRFEIPKAEGHFEGNKTVITNFPQICSYLRRDCNHVLKFILRELASPGVMKGSQLVLQTKVPSGKINEKIKEYVEEFVMCKECKKPDTELLKQDKFLFLHCLACGAKHAVRAKIQ